MQLQNEILLADVNITELCVEVMIIRELKVQREIRGRQVSRVRRPGWKTDVCLTKEKERKEAMLSQHRCHGLWAFINFVIECLVGL